MMLLAPYKPLSYKGAEFPTAFKLPEIPFEREGWHGNKRKDMVNPFVSGCVK
jgi:hypothetical protein